MTVIALTGSIGSGKSEASDIFRKLGAEIIDADHLSREVVQPGSIGLTEIVSAFGREILNVDNSLNRKKLGNLVFNDRTELEKLNSITHPLIKQLAQSKFKKSDKSVIIYVVPLFFETNNDYPEIKSVIVVASPKATCIKRIVARDSLSTIDAEKRYDSQLPIEVKKARATWIIENDGDLENLRSQVEKVWCDITNKNGKK